MCAGETTGEQDTPHHVNDSDVGSAIRMHRDDGLREELQSIPGHGTQGVDARECWVRLMEERLRSRARNPSSSTPSRATGPAARATPLPTQTIPAPNGGWGCSWGGGAIMAGPLGRHVPSSRQPRGWRGVVMGAVRQGPPHGKPLPTQAALPTEGAQMGTLHTSRGGYQGARAAWAAHGSQ